MKDWVNGKNRLRSTKSDPADFQKHLIEVLKAHSERKISNSIVLDVGCGDGALSLKISEVVKQVHCCDITSAYIALEFQEKLEFELISRLEVKYQPRFFDCIYSFGVVQYLCKEEFDNLNSRLFNLLKPGGVIVHANLLDKGKIFNYYNKPNSLVNVVKLIVSGALRSIITDRIWNDGSRWHVISKLCKDIEYKYIITNGFSDERSDIIIFK